jgi:hypothetical protein
MKALLNVVKDQIYLSTIQGILIDTFLSLLLSSESEGAGPAKGLSSAEVARQSFTELHLYADSPTLCLKSSGTSFMINYLKMMIEVSQLNVSSLYSTEVVPVDDSASSFR